MNILGLTTPISWNSAAALVKGGKLVAAVEEERYNGIKHSPRMLPLKSIEFCFSHAKIKAADVDGIAFGFRSPSAYYFATFLENLKETDLYRALREGGTLAEYIVGMIRLKEWMARKGFRLKGPRKVKIFFYPHHIAHAASAYRCSGFEQANIITLDGQGEDDSGLIGVGSNGEIRRLGKIGHHQSLGWVYGETTDLLGFLKHSHEGKIMGLAGWGKRKLSGNRFWQVDSDSYRLKRGWLSKFWKHFGPRRDRYDKITDRHRNIALTVQHFTEEAGKVLAKRVYKETSITNFCLAGGVTLNCDMNAKIWELPFVENIFIQPGASDAGTAIGAALEMAHQLGENADFKMEHAYWGPEYSNKEIEAVLKETKLSYKKVKNIEKLVAREVAQGKIVAWFQGRLEFGPRALGNRSILAHPSKKGMKDKVNKEVKHRESWRPFSPSVLDEAGPDYFENYYTNPFMLLTFDVKKGKEKEVSQAMHIDGTARIQSVTKKTNPRYYKLIAEFAKITGIPIVLNTSFNDKGQPIVNTPREAIKTLASTGLDMLAIGDFIVEKR